MPKTTVDLLVMVLLKANVTTQLRLGRTGEACNKTPRLWEILNHCFKMLSSGLLVIQKKYYNVDKSLMLLEIVPCFNYMDAKLNDVSMHSGEFCVKPRKTL